MRMFEQQHRLERKLAGRDVAELLAIPAQNSLRSPSSLPSVLVLLGPLRDCCRAQLHPRRHRTRDRPRAPAASTAGRGPHRGRAHLGPPALGADARPCRHGAARARRVPEDVASRGRPPAGLGCRALCRRGSGLRPGHPGHPAGPVPPDGLGRRPVAVDLPLPRQRERDACDRRPGAPAHPFLALWRGVGPRRARHPRPHEPAAGTRAPAAIPASPPRSGRCGRLARCCAGPTPACSRRRSVAATGST